jgi:hypothetical protein
MNDHKISVSLSVLSLSRHGATVTGVGSTIAPKRTTPILLRLGDIDEACQVLSGCGDNQIGAAIIVRIAGGQSTGLEPDSDTIHLDKSSVSQALEYRHVTRVPVRDGQV